MILMRVLQGMGVDMRRPQLADGRLDDIDRLGAFGDVGIAQIAELELRTQQLGRPPGFRRANIDVAAGRAEAERQDVQQIPSGLMLCQRAAATDLDVVRMCADGQHALLLPLTAAAGLFGQKQRLLHELRRAHRLEHQAIDPALHGQPQELRALVAGNNHDGQPPVVSFHILQKFEVLRRRRVNDDEIPLLLVDHPRRGDRIGSIGQPRFRAGF